MKKIGYKKYKTSILLALSTMLFACSLDHPPEDQVSDPVAIVSINSAKKALAAAYASYPAYANATIWVQRSDDFIPSVHLGKEVTINNTYVWEERTLIEQAEYLWKELYETIAKCNVLIERLPKVVVSNQLEQNEWNLIKQRIHYLKGLCYFDLLRIFCPTYTQNSASFGVLLKDNMSITKNQKRHSIPESANEIDHLLSISSFEDNQDIPHYITPWAAELLRAELALWIGDYQKALNLALPLYEKYKNKQTSVNILDIWNNTRKPLLSLFALDTRNMQTSPYLEFEYTLYSTYIDDYLIVNPSITYISNDIRSGVYSLENPNQNGTFILGKYRKLAYERQQIRYFTIVRVANIAFVIAEAYAQLGDSRAVEIMNQILTTRQASLTTSKSSDKDVLLQLVLTEKQKEFVGEPHRFFDLKRNRKSISRQRGKTNVTISDTDYRWTLPIPASERRENTKISQNQGWNIGN